MDLHINAGPFFCPSDYICMITINCETKDSLAMEELTEFQGELKHREESDIKKIAASIIKHGFAFPFFVWSHDEINHVFDGHGRLLALKYLKSKGEEIPNLPVVYINAKNEAEAKEMLLKLNSHYGKMTTESVIEFLDGVEIDFDEIALPDTFMDFSVETEPEETEGDDEVPEVQEEAVSQPGEMYALGDSILMCGDSTNEEDVSRLMGGLKADMVFTDPPYGVAYTGGMQFKADGSVEHNNRKMIMNDNVDIYEDVVKILSKFSVGPCYIFYAGTHSAKLYEAAEKYGTIHALLIWVKNGGYGALNAQYKQKHEPFIYWTPKGAKTNWCGATTETTIWEIKKDGVNKLHPTQKPTALCEKALKNHSAGLILDLFGDSGSTLIACEKLNRKARIMELDPHYCDVIRRRYTQWAKENNKPITSGCLE